MKISRICEECGGRYERYPSQLGKFCSRECSQSNQRLPSLTCPICGTSFRPHGRHSKTCSISCGRRAASAGKSYPKLDGGKPIHRAVAEQMLGRPLKRGEVVHHIDRNKLNNDPSNLMVFPSQAAHMAHHAKEDDFSLNNRIREEVSA